MVAQEKPRDEMSVEEWRALLDHSPDERYEYIDGYLRLMSGGTIDHGRIGLNACIAVDAALGTGPCRVHNSDVAVRLSATRYVFPDLSVSCDAADQGMSKEVQSPRLVLEVLSESTEAFDRGRKFSLYRSVSSLQEYVLVSTDRQLVEVYQRQQQGWKLSFYGADERISLASLNLQIPVSTFYRLTTVPTQLAAEGTAP